MVKMIQNFLVRECELQNNVLFQRIVEEAKIAQTNKQEKWRNLLKNTTNFKALLTEIDLTKKQFIDEIILEFGREQSYEDISDFIVDCDSYIKHETFKYFDEDEEIVPDIVQPDIVHPTIQKKNLRRIQPTMIHNPP
jgi:hypothetical protein